ncbi:MAG TPA: beta-L-arabinofuranosidase domain-containing protein, partial [Actinomycetota bacterium]|nr:beta-L-arabinofuranosidase domain-containing protein [Actinomycetota bacterium]
WQDHEPVREAATVAGHAVRQLYLDCGAVDVAVELDDHALLAAVRRRWRDLVATRTYLTGGMGSRHRDESFGDPFELPPDRAYAETCAAIASVMLAWRLLLATGEAGYADAIERAAYNGVLPGVSLSGTRFFYVNALQRRTRRAWEPPGHGERAPWYPCACCPPNLMRLLSSWEQYLATSDDSGVQLHQYAAAEVEADVAGEAVRLSVRTGYPWEGRVEVEVVRAPEHPWTLSLRVPSWCRSAALTGPGGDGPVAAGPGAAELTRRWEGGDTVVLDLDLPVRVTVPDPRVDAVRGCVAVERGPLVYCVESADLPAGTELEDLRWDPGREPVTAPRPDIGDAVVGITVPLAGAGTVGAIPYFAWANRGAGAMRVWVPR